MKEEMIKWARDLYPICRSLTGAGTRKTLEYFEALNPELERIKFETGEQVFDWTIPKEWNIRDAYIEHESGQRFAEFTKHNLHVVGYSIPINTEMDLDELMPHIYTLPDQPEWIPYVTSYYREHWGFCMSENDKKQLPPGKYKAVIDSELEPGHLEISHAVINGASSREIFFSSYVCHPSMANNELSGPVLLNALMKYIKEEMGPLKYSYRFVLLPETIGSISYLSKFLGELKDKVFCGFNLSCVGDERAYSHLQSRHGDTLADKALSVTLKPLENVITYPFLERGSDERQYCAPGVDLPLCGFSRSLFRHYPEYHTSADNFDVVTENGLDGAYRVMTTIINAFELGLFPKTTVLGEPQLGKRGLFPNISKKGSYDALKARMDFLAYADGQTSLFDICETINQPLNVIVDEYRILSKEGLIVDETSR